MADDEHFRRLERMYLKARCNAHYAPRIRIGEGEAEVVIPVRPDFFHAMDALHGSVYFKALDDAAWFAANSRIRDRFVLTSTFNVHLLGHVTEGSLRAHGRVVHEGKRQLVVEAVATDAAGRQVARGSGTFTISNLPLASARDYA